MKFAIAIYSHSLFIFSLLAPLVSTLTPHSLTPTLRSLTCCAERTTEHYRVGLQPRPTWKVGQDSSTLSDTERIEKLSRRLNDVHHMLEGLCNIIISSDDIALGEREACKVGKIFMDARGNMTRSPVFLRDKTRHLMLEYGLEPQVVNHKWQLQRYIDI